jgi:hypothetical protein
MNATKGFYMSSTAFRDGLKAGIWICGFVLAAALLVPAADEKPTTFHGQIADTQCAMNIHSLTRSHAEMLKAKATGGTEGSCATYCVRYLGGDFVLSSKGEVYRIDNQDKVRLFAGQKVKITGTLDPKTKTIRLLEIEAAEKE